jgi:hypothetical protein
MRLYNRRIDCLLKTNKCPPLNNQKNSNHDLFSINSRVFGNHLSKKMKYAALINASNVGSIGLKLVIIEDNPNRPGGNSTSELPNLFGCPYKPPKNVF